MTTNGNPDPDVAELEANLRASNIVTWLEFEAAKLGTPLQRKMHAEGSLTDYELRELARAELYKPLDEFPRWKNARDLHPREVPHAPSCAGGDSRVRYKSLDLEVVPRDWNGTAAYTAIRHATNAIAAHEWLTKTHTKVEVVLVAHSAVCTHCKAVATRYSVRVSIPWAGRELVREYALQP